MKRRYFFYLLLFTLPIIGLYWEGYYYRNLSKDALTAQRNIANSKRLKISMTKGEVVGIMGYPEDSETTDDKGLFYQYATYDESNPYISVRFNVEKQVSHIYLYRYDDNTQPK